MRIQIHGPRRLLALATIVAALAAPTASAAPVDPVGTTPDESARSKDRSPVVHTEDYATVVRAEDYAPVEAPSAPASAPSAGDGFDWGDAGIGAGTILALVLIGAGAAITVGYRSGRGHEVA